MESAAALLKQLEALAPWHFDLEIAHGLRTIQGNRERYEDAAVRNVAVVRPEEMEPLLRRVYPEGLCGRSFLDAACNSGGYSFLAKRLGADRTFGFDARELWIRQAEFLKRHWPGDTSGMRFEQRGIHDLESEEKFDVALFKGVFYHLPDPIAGLERVAKLTHELIIVDSETDGERGDLCLRLNFEEEEHVMSGVHDLAWFPSGPDLLARVLQWLGFPEVREIAWHTKHSPRRRAPGRCRVIGARSAALLARFDATPG
jgi:SAM-dependent methyltransferase